MDNVEDKSKNHPSGVMLVNDMVSDNSKQQKENKLNKKEKHKVDAEKQVLKIILEIKKLSEIAHKHKGEFSQEDTDKIFNALRAEMGETRKSFKLEKDKLDFSL